MLLFYRRSAVRGYKLAFPIFAIITSYAGNLGQAIRQNYPEEDRAEKVQELIDVADCVFYHEKTNMLIPKDREDLQFIKNMFGSSNIPPRSMN